MTQPLLDLNELSLFIAVIDEGSLSAASKATCVPKATLSRKMTQLEDRLGVKLLHREARKLSTTEAGATLYQQCREALRQIREAARVASQTPNTLSGLLRVSVPGDFGRSVLWPIVSAFLRTYPEVSLELYVSDRIVDVVGEGFDLAIRIGDVLNQDLVMKPLGEIGAMLVASPVYLAKNQPITQPKDLQNHPCVIFSSPPFGHNWKLKGPEQQIEEVNVKGSLSVNSLSMARSAAVDGFGIARLPSYICDGDLSEGKLVRVLPEWSMGTRVIYAAYASRVLSAKAKGFIEFLQKYAKF
jgi:DNA-binding transcriptional LysR family regulator